MEASSGGDNDPLDGLPDVETYVRTGVVFYALLDIFCIVHSVALFARAGSRRASGLRAQWLTATLLMVFGCGRLLEFGLRLAGSPLFWSDHSATASRSGWYEAHLLWLLPQAALISVESATLYWWDRVLHVVDAGHASPKVVIRWATWFNVLLYALVAGFVLWDVAAEDGTSQRYAVNLASNITISVVQLLLLTGFACFGWRLWELHLNLFRPLLARFAARSDNSVPTGAARHASEWTTLSESDRVLADGRDAPSTGATTMPTPGAKRSFRRTAVTLRLFALVAAVAVVCLFVQTSVLIYDSFWLATRGGYPGLNGNGSGPAGTFDYTNPLFVLYTYRVCEVAPALSLLLVLFRLQLLAVDGEGGSSSVGESTLRTELTTGDSSMYGTGETDATV